MRRVQVSHENKMRELPTRKVKSGSAYNPSVDQLKNAKVSDLLIVPVSRPNGTANKLAPEDAPAHDWYRFVLSFPPHLVREYLRRFRIGTNRTVLDPFCGTGTTVVECKKLGVPSVGIEAHPMSRFAAATKTDWTPNPDALLSHAARIAKAAKRKLAEQGIEDSGSTSLPRSFTFETLPSESLSILLTDSISPLPLHKTLVLLQCLAAGCNPSIERHEKLALAQALVTTIGNLHFGPEVGVGKVKDDSR